jgi:hypothetical protein
MTVTIAALAARRDSIFDSARLPAPMTMQGRAGEFEEDGEEDYCLALRIGEGGVVDAENVHLDARGDQGDDGVHVLGDSRGGVEGDCGPDILDIGLGQVVLLEEGAGGVGSVDLEALVGRAVAGDEAEVVKHGSGVEQLAVEFEAAPLTGESCEVVDTAGVVEEQLGLGVADELRDLPSEGTLGNFDGFGKSYLLGGRHDGNLR